MVFLKIEQSHFYLREKVVKLVPCSCKHGCDLRAHVICKLPHKVAAAAMDQSVATRLVANSDCFGDDVVAETFSKAECRVCELGNHYRI